MRRSDPNLVEAVRAAIAEGTSYSEDEPGFCRVEDADWEFVDAFDISLVDSPQARIRWFASECCAPHAEEAGYAALLTEDIREPLVALLRDGVAYVWAGNHRVGAALTRGTRYLRAYVGTPRVSR